MRRRIQHISKRAARERRALESDIKELREGAKKRSREIASSLTSSERHVSDMQRMGKRLTSDVKYYRSKVFELTNELKEAKLMVSDAKAASATALRHARQAESDSGRKDVLLQKNIDRRASAEAAYRVRAGENASFKKELIETTAELERVCSERDELAAERDALAKQQERLADQVAKLEQHAREDKAKVDKAYSSVREAQAVMKKSKKSTKAVEAEREEVQMECDALAGVTKLLIEELEQTKETARGLHADLLRVQPPKFVDVEAGEGSMPERSKRRAVHSDRHYLGELFSSRPWRPGDIVKALEDAKLLDKINDTRLVCHNSSKKAPLPRRYA